MSCVYLSNIPHNATEDGLRAIVSSRATGVTGVEIKGKSAFVTFRSKEETESAAPALNGCLYNGNVLSASVMYDMPDSMKREGSWYPASPMGAY